MRFILCLFNSSLLVYKKHNIKDKIEKQVNVEKEHVFSLFIYLLFALDDRTINLVTLLLSMKK